MREAVTKLEKATIDLCRHPETCAYAGVMMMGNISVVDNIPTACTDGVNEKYSTKFVESLTLPEVRAVKLHEGLHKVLKHMVRGLPFWKKNPDLANIAADYVVNDVIVNVKDKEFVKLPKGALIDSKFHGWSFPEIFRELEKEEEEGRGGQRGEPLDEHDMSNAQEMGEEEMKKYVEDINEAIHQGSLLAGRFGQKLPKAITDSVLPVVDWTETLREFISSIAQGNDEHTYRKFDKRLILDDIISPGVVGEKIGDIVIGYDMSGSITDALRNKFASELQSLCEQVMPDAVRVIWWDHNVCGEQVLLPEQFGDIKRALKPLGGGGTRAGCVSEYIIKNSYKCDCVLMLTDGYVENEIKWDVMAPTLWLVTENKNFMPPAGGKMVKVEN
jgi:hypothetical protein